jgi:Pentapeptide repeats (8 copies)
VALLGVGLLFSLVLAQQTRDLLADAEAAPRAALEAEPPQAAPSVSAPAISAKDRADLRRGALQFQADSLTKLWTGVAQMIGVVVLAVGGYFTWRNLRLGQANFRLAYRNLRATQDRLDVDEEKLETDKEAQITNRFTQAVQLLGTPRDGGRSLEGRLGGIYALERIARDSPRDHWAIMEVLAAYVRESAAPPTGANATPTLPLDVQAAVTVLGRRKRPENWPELGPVDLTGAYLVAASLEGKDLAGAQLSGVNLSRATLVGTVLAQATLLNAKLEDAVLKAANLSGANLTQAALRNADLELATLTGATIDAADLVGAKHLTEDQLVATTSRKGARLPRSLANLEIPADQEPS